jgi:geranylgeranyl diphosphate synthase, type II
VPAASRMREADELRALAERFLAALPFALELGKLEEALRYSLLGGGKRIRPVLCLATGEALGRDPDELLPAACSLELVHTFSLVHDDLPALDDDDLRRGQPSAHVRFGEDVAILAGDGLFAEALRLVAEHQSGPPERVVEVLRMIGAATGIVGMVGGQYVDVTEPDLDPAGLRSLHELKTGKLIATSVRVPLALAGMSEPERIPYTRFAEELGVLFQIVDDILDVTGSDEELGKPHGSDERHGKVTYVSLYGLERARELAAESHGKARRALADASGNTRDLERVADFIHTRQR